MNKKIVKNYFYNTIYQVIAIIAPIITEPYVSRVLHADGVGLYSYTNTIAIVFSLFAGLGFTTYGQREVAYYQEDKHKRSIIFFEIVSFRCLLTFVVAVIYLAYSIIFKTEYTRYLLPQVVIIFATIFDMSWYFQGLENFKIIVFRNLVVKLATIACTFIFVRTADDVGIYILIHALSPFISNVVYCFVIKEHVDKVSLSELHPIRHLKGTIEFFLPLIAVQIYSYLDKLMLKAYMETTVENGYYEQARKITSIVVTLIVSLNAVMMSRISNLYAKSDKEQIKKYYSKTFSIIMMMLFPICLGLILISDNFVLWFFGDEYQPVSSLLKMCSILIALMCVGNFVGVQFLSPTGRQNKMTIAYAIAAVSNVIMNMIFIPRLYSKGALIASIIAEGISCFTQIWFLIHSEFKFNFCKGIWKYLVSAITMGLIIQIIHKLVLFTGVVASLFDVVFGGGLYFVMLLILREDNIMEFAYLIKNKIKKQEN